MSIIGVKSAPRKGHFEGRRGEGFSSPELKPTIQDADSGRDATLLTGAPPEAFREGSEETRRTVRQQTRPPKRPTTAADPGPQSDPRLVEPGSAAGPVGSPFPVAVPDYVQADWLIAMPTPLPTGQTGKAKRGRRRICGGLHWAI